MKSHHRERHRKPSNEKFLFLQKTKPKAFYRHANGASGKNNGKEVKDISDTSMVYHVNSTIRQKLGLKTNDVNLSTFIRELFGTN